MLLEWNHVEPAYPESSIHELFEAQARRTPNAVALIHEEQKLSYAELEQHSNRLAAALSGLGAGPESLIGICMERTPDMVAGMLAVLKTGAAYVPLDPSYP